MKRLLKQPIGRADLHIHTTASDGLFTVREVLDHVARESKLNVIAITDHDVLDASLWAYARRDRYPFEIVPGVEVSSADGHVLALWVTQAIPPRMSLSETAAAIHEQGGIAILAHPCHFYVPDVTRGSRKFLRRPQWAVEAGIDALETHNAGILIPGVNRLAGRLARGLNIATVANSDAHTLGAIGSGYTMFTGHTADALRTAIETKQTATIGKIWPRADYRLYIADLIARRGKICGDTEFDFEMAYDEEEFAPVPTLDIVTDTVQYPERLHGES